MNTHIERLPEFYPVRGEYPVIANWLTRIFPINRLVKEWHKEDLPEMHAKKILIVDDETKIREAYRRIFSLLGYDVMTAMNAVEAQDMLVRYRYDIVLLDINMYFVDGVVLSELMRTFHKGIKVVVSSVYPIDEQKERIKDADGYFDKSDDKDVLVSLVSSLLGDATESRDALNRL